MSSLHKSAVVGAPGDWKPLVLDGTRLYLYRHWDGEQSLVRFLRERSQVPAPGVDIALLREGLGRLFPGGSGETDWQRVAAAAAVLKRFCVITGGPGTGKTTTVAGILALLLEQAKAQSIRIALAAPTGKAAARLQEAIREAAGRLACEDGIRSKLAGMEASTLHRLLGRRPRSSSMTPGEEEMLPFDAVVVDEASMVSLQLLFSLVRVPACSCPAHPSRRPGSAGLGRGGRRSGRYLRPRSQAAVFETFRGDGRSRKRPERPAHAAGGDPIARQRLHRRTEAQLPLRRRKRYRRPCPADQGRGSRRGALSSCAQRATGISDGDGSRGRGICRGP